jgi:uncharacterized protein YjbI with pentapeptide repeats
MMGSPVHVAKLAAFAVAKPTGCGGVGADRCGAISHGWMLPWRARLRTWGPARAVEWERVLDRSELLERYAKGERDFRGAELRGADLRGVNLREVDLSVAKLSTANLMGADLMGADLIYTDLSDADLSNADLSFTDLTGANMSGAKLHNADLSMSTCPLAILTDATLNSANFSDADVKHTNFTDANLTGATLTNATLSRANFTDANLADADLTGAELTGANLRGAKLSGTNFEGAVLGTTLLAGIELGPLVRSTIHHSNRSQVDWTAVVRSVNEPLLKDFLRRSGMPDVFAEYMVDCARSLQPAVVFSLLQSTFISYGGPDEAFARKLNEALERRGVTTFFFKDDAPPGERLHRVMRKGINEHDRTILVCSEASLQRPGLLNELEETLAREARDGGRTYLIPVRLDDYVIKGWEPVNYDLAQTVRDRVISDFREHEDTRSFDAEMAKLIAVLKKPVVHR